MVHMLGLDFYNFPHTAKGKRGRLKYEVYFERTEDGMFCLDVPKAEKKKGQKIETASQKSICEDSFIRPSDD